MAVGYRKLVSLVEVAFSMIVCEGSNVRKLLRIQPINATPVLNLSAGVTYSKVLRGRSFSWHPLCLDEFASMPTSQFPWDNTAWTLSDANLKSTAVYRPVRHKNATGLQYLLLRVF
jgi:hypothetical protein